MFGALTTGDDVFFRPDGTSTFTDAGWIRGLRAADLYKQGLAPKDSINWATTMWSRAFIRRLLDDR